MDSCMLKKITKQKIIRTEQTRLISLSKVLMFGGSMVSLWQQESGRLFWCCSFVICYMCCTFSSEKKSIKSSGDSLFIILFLGINRKLPFVVKSLRRPIKLTMWDDNSIVLSFWSSPYGLGLRLVRCSGPLHKLRGAFFWYDSDAFLQFWWAVIGKLS